ncbi:jg13810 [Pararge aegeria aegeria]|uniref:Jg13810 protein n=1 Tax=Pararge aegeria aegeria TaxID=348720 RepID=A0A8S4S601_9NEOP|nr:jg13810 [Pararge aegeria aegeria]
MACKKPLGPGPGAYRLPTTVGFNLHDPSRYRNPMFSFGTHAGFRLKRLSPGPAYRIDRITREGLMTSPAWSFGARYVAIYGISQKYQSKETKNPYSYSFGTKHGDYAPPLIVKEDTMDCL